MNDDESAEENTYVGGRFAPTNLLSLLVIGPSGSTTVPVPEQGVLTLGRAPECDVRVDDSKLSRRHATLCARGDNVYFADLGSLNGSFLRDERLPANVEVRIGPGDSVTIGDTVLVLQRATSFAARPRHIWPHGHFEALLEEECARASRGGAPFAVVRLRLGANVVATAATLKDVSAPTVLAHWLRETDVVAKYAPHDYEVLLIKTSADEADARARALSTELTASGGAFDLGVAAFPRDGRTPEALIERTNRIVQRESDPVAAASPSVIAKGALERMGRVVERVASGTINVLILGETGVGKEVLARRIHDLSPRAKHALVSINCAALSESLLESELFGHEKGAFTGALAAKAGLLESGNGGSVFLDEIGEMPLSTQAKLLRVLEQREVTRVGAVRPRPIDVRFMSATNRNVEADVAAGRFRQDLFFRLNGITLSLPPLRERVDEIEPLALMFIEQACRAMKRERIARLTPESLAILQSYQWPGNIRELRNVIERAVLLCSGDVITQSQLPIEKMGPVLTQVSIVERPPPLGLGPGTHIVAEKPQSGTWDAVTVTRTADTVPPGAPRLPQDERARIVQALEQCVWNQSQAAKLLGISRGTLIKRIAEFGLPRPRKRE